MSSGDAGGVFKGIELSANAKLPVIAICNEEHTYKHARAHTHTHIADRAVSNSETACYRHLQRGALSHTHAHTHLHFTTGDTALSNSETAYYRHLQRGKLPEDPLSRVQMLKNTVLSPSPVAAPPAAEVCVCVRSCVCVWMCK